MNLVTFLVGLVTMMTLYVRGCLNFSTSFGILCIPQTKGETVEITKEAFNLFFELFDADYKAKRQRIEAELEALDLWYQETYYTVFIPQDSPL